MLDLDLFSILTIIPFLFLNTDSQLTSPNIGKLFDCLGKYIWHQRFPLSVSFLAWPFLQQLSPNLTIFSCSFHYIHCSFQKIGKISKFEILLVLYNIPEQINFSFQIWAHYHLTKNDCKKSLNIKHH